MKKSLLLILTMLFMSSCSDYSKPKVTDFDQDTTLVAKQIPDTRYIMDIPADHVFKPKEGEDFIVYYLTPRSEGTEKTFSIGLYFGNHPSEPEAPAPGCRTTIEKHKLLGSTTEWYLYDCDSSYSLDAVTELSKYQFLHAFGWGKEEHDLKRVMSMLSTLREMKD